jgi:hypothetical protein
VAHFSGQVIQINQGVGTQVIATRPVVSIAQTRGQLVVRTFVSSSQSEVIGVGTRVLMDVSGASNIPGRVTGISDIPLTADEAASSIGAASLAREMGATDDSFAVMITPDRGWISHFHGLEYASLTFIYGQQHPINYVF